MVETGGANEDPSQNVTLTLVSDPGMLPAAQVAAPVAPC